MRWIVAALALTFAADASADAPNARTLYVERRGVLELDARCRLFAPIVRAALTATLQQAHNSLLRDGWNNAQVGNLEQTVVAAARARPCEDQRTVSAAANARQASAGWLRANIMQFPGWSQTWTAHRIAGADGWRLNQTLAAGVTFGVRVRDGREQLVLTVQTARNQPLPRSVTLVMRDVRRSGATEIPLNQRVAFGLNAGAPAPNVATSYTGVAMPGEALRDGQTLAVFAFSDMAFGNLLALDPRETAELHVAGAPTLLSEVGDIGVARSFIVIR